MIRAKNGNIIFKNQAELNAETNRRIKKILDKEIIKHKQEATQEALVLLLPMVCNALHESHGFGEKRLNKFIDRFMIHVECLQDGITGIDDYQEWCKEQGYTFIEVVVE